MPNQINPSLSPKKHVIHKEILPSLGDNREYTLPLDAEILHMGVDPKGDRCFWYMFSDRQKTRTLKIRNVGTGWDILDTEFGYMGTIVHGDRVHHFLEIYPDNRIIVV